MEFILCDKNPEVIKAWRHFFDRAGKVSIVEGDILAQDVSAVVMPMNSFGILDEGLSEELNRKTEGLLETRSRRLILDKYAGELPVGNAEVVPSGLEKPYFLVLTPVARVPQKMASAPSINSYLATRAALRSVASFIRNGSGSSNHPLESVAFVGLGAGNGGVSPATAAFQMYEAYCQVVLGQVPNFATVEAATAHDQELRKNRFM